MRYVKKLEAPNFFYDDVKDFKSWDDYDFNKDTRKTIWFINMVL